jgi:hypothetical protein
MWIPIILVLWTTDADWTIFPPPVRPYETKSECHEAIKTAKGNIMNHPKYKRGYSMCVKMILGENT